jgi:uncharacterized protein
MSTASRTGSRARVTGLLDVNVLVALGVPEHEHHDAALTWYTSEANRSWATCAVTRRRGR